MSASSVFAQSLSEPMAPIAAPVAVADDVDENYFVLGGAFQDEYVWETALFWKPHYESNFFVGAGYQRFFFETDWNFKAGVEFGAGLRFGKNPSAELWTGLVLRYDGFTVGDFTISPAITGGFSLVSDTIGVETRRANQIDDGVPLLFYMGPEISISNANHPDMEVFARIHHRSGGYGIIAEIDGSNAATVGLRWKF